MQTGKHTHPLIIALLLLFATATLTSCEQCDCEIIATQDPVEGPFDCPDLKLNMGDPCDYSNDGVNNGVVGEDCACVPNYPVLPDCPGFIQNGNFEIVTGDPNASIDQDIDLATNWKPLWQSGSLADLYDEATTYYGNPCFVGPTPQQGVHAAMWIQNQPNADANPTYREGMFNELTTPINQNTGVYNLSFEYANMSVNCNESNDVKVGVYGVYHPISDPLPANPTGVGTPSNLDLFGASNTVFLGEVIITSSTTNEWATAAFSIDTHTLTMPESGINHIMITNSHLPYDHYGNMYLGFDNFCLTN